MVYHHKIMRRVHSWSRYDVGLWPQRHLQGFWYVSFVRQVALHWLTIFGTWVYHHKRMCSEQYLSRYDFDLRPCDQTYTDLDRSSCPTRIFCLLWHWYTIFNTLVYHLERIFHAYMIPIIVNRAAYIGITCLLSFRVI